MEDILNCISWVVLTIALIVAMFKMVKSHNEVKMAIVRKLDAQTEKIKDGGCEGKAQPPQKR